MSHIRAAGSIDAGAMADLLNEVIALGGTTAMTKPVTGADIRGWMAKDPRGIWHIAEDDSGGVLGFQWADQWDPGEPGLCHIATFTKVGQTGLGIGSALFEATCRAAAAAGFTVIEAEIRADNAGGLAYYQSRGFETCAMRRAVRLDDGTCVDKVVTRYEL